ncbi:dihydrofolate reductase [Allocatelliglobosispora scoriae]|uniref:Dihydrofolate reductase n=1 Tax=Allocatelliglobosispora scoriae TaxID=643052 RepID=A0A841BDM5_9ACTN|nr:dihydrofolate reductase family protein [Allocatelliglobosispora scoriae]MBB5867207.1 dihydrofolate reductase [Allocatelliglobosispora scoriae]
MSRVIADISMSLDGYVTAPGVDMEHGLGKGGESLHTWVFAKDSPEDAAITERSMAETGAVIMGRRTFDFIDGPNGWNDELGYGAGPDQATSGPPVFVVTHSAPASWRLGARFRFAGSVAEAVEQALAAAGGKDVVVMGGGDVVRQAVLSGYADELRIHLSPVLLGGGTPLFAGDGATVALQQTDVVVTPYATHLTYQVGG